jgi:hypothetical protein
MVQSHNMIIIAECKLNLKQHLILSERYGAVLPLLINATGRTVCWLSQTLGENIH